MMNYFTKRELNGFVQDHFFEITPPAYSNFIRYSNRSMIFCG